MQKQETYITNSPSQTVWKQLLQTKKQLQHPSTIKQQNKFLQKLTLIHSQLSHLQCEAVPKIDVFIFDVLKPIARQITNFNPRQYDTIKQMKLVVLKIIEHYCNIFLKYENINSFEILRELLNRDSWLFSKKRTDAAAAAPPPPLFKNKQKQGQGANKMDSQQNLIEEEKKYKWAKSRMFYTEFHQDSCQLIFQLLRQSASQLHAYKLNSIKQLISFMYFLQDYIFDEQIYKFALQSFQTMNKSILIKPSKQQIKQANKDVLQDISQKLLKLLHYYSDKDVKTQITLLGPKFAVNLINGQGSNMEMKILGIKILQKFASGFYFRSHEFVKDEGFGVWLVKCNLWNMLISKNSDPSLVLSSQYIIKLMINRGKPAQDKFCALLNLIWQVKPDIRSMYLKTIDPTKLGYPAMNLILQNFKQIKQNPDLFSQQYFTLMEYIARYSYKQIKFATQIVLNVLQKHFFNFKQYSMKRKALDAFKYCFQKLIDNQKETNDKMALYVEIISKFITNPNYLTLSISRRIFESEDKRSSYALEKAAKNLVQNRKIIQAIINQMGENIDYKHQLMYFLKAILVKYKSYSMSGTLSFQQNVLIQSLKYPQIFSQLINFSPSDICQKMFTKVYQQYITKPTTEQQKQQPIKQINFSAIRQMFYKVNYMHVEIIQPQYFRPKQYLIKCDPQNLKFMNQLQQILYKCRYPRVQEKCAELICDVHTKFAEMYLEKSKFKLREFMESFISRIQSIQIGDDFFTNQQKITELYGNLCLIKQLLAATQIHGVNNLKAHNSLITTSMIKVKIWNNASYGDDVQKCYQKTVPSNLTLFDLLSKIGQKFKCGQHELYLQQGNDQALPIKMNGFTLLQLGFGKQYRQLNAYKNSKVQLRKQKLKINDSQQLHPRFLQILKQIFKFFANNQNKMGEKQIVNYIKGVTNSSSHSRDTRVSQLLNQYDTDKDGYLTEQNFIKFYSDNCDGGDKEDNVWNNLSNLHYRKDLRKFNEPIDPVDNQNLFRYYLKNSKKSYQMLFKLSNLNKLNHKNQICQENQQNDQFDLLKLISQLSKAILVHLPTCQYFMQSSISCTIDFLNKNPFQISYIMINIRYFLQKEIHKRRKIQKIKQKLERSKMEIQQGGQMNNNNIQDDNTACEKNKQNNQNNGTKGGVRKQSYDEDSSMHYNHFTQEQQIKMLQIEMEKQRQIDMENSKISKNHMIKNKRKPQTIVIDQQNNQQQRLQNNQQQSKHQTIIIDQQQSHPLQQQKEHQQNISKDNKPKHQQINYIKRFIQNKNDIKIFQLIKMLSSKQRLTEQQQVVRVVSITILRTLVNLPDLNQNYATDKKYNIESFKKFLENVNQLNLVDEDYQFFIQLTQNCLSSGQFTLFEAGLALTFLKKGLQWKNWIEQALFHQQIQIRKNVLNFLMFYSIKYQFPFDFFNMDIRINQSRCQQYFTLLYITLGYNTQNNDYCKILNSTLDQIQFQSQQIGPSYFNPLLNGNLTIAIFIISTRPQIHAQILSTKQKQTLYNIFENQLKKTLHNDNRRIIYDLMSIIDVNKFVDYLQNMIKTIKPTDKYQIKENFVGIKNLGSTCYMNSILQQFYIIDSFRDIVLGSRLYKQKLPQKTDVNGFQIVDDFLYQLQKMYINLQRSKKKYYYPKQFCLTIKDYDQKPINTSIQEDAHEFLNKLFFIMQQYLKKNKKLNQLEKIFQGKTICQISCKDCESKKQKIQDFYHLALQVKDLNTLSESFDKFIAPQIIEDYFCQKCQKKSQKITKQTFLSTTPQILIVNLQRIIFDLNTFQKVKVHSKLQFPQYLNLQNFIHSQSNNQNRNYKLKGVVIHSGTSQGGHYYSLIKVNSDWYKFNDETVSLFNFSDLEREAYGGASSTDNWGDSQYSTNAYILFYEIEKNIIKEPIIIQQSTKQAFINDQNPQKRQLIQKQESKRLTMQLKKQLQNKQLMQQQQSIIQSVQSSRSTEQVRTQQQQMTTSINGTTSNSHNAKKQPISLQQTTIPEQQQQSPVESPTREQQQQLHLNLNNKTAIRQPPSQNQIQHKQQQQLNNKQQDNNQDQDQSNGLTLVKEQFITEVDKQNSLFYQQLQIHQESFFEIINRIYIHYRPKQILGQFGHTNQQNSQNNVTIPYFKNWQQLPLLNLYQKLFDIYFEVLTFWSVFNNIQNNTYFQTGTSIYQLLSILPHKTQQFLLQKFDQKSWSEIMCNSNEQNLRQTYKVVLNKVIYVYSHYRGLNLQEFNYQQLDEQNLFQNQQQAIEKINKNNKKQRIKQILKYMLNLATSDTISKSIFKSYYFFEFWRINLDCNDAIVVFCLNNDYLLTLMDLLMANESPFAKKDKKRQDFPYQVAVPLVQSMLKLIQRKKNLKGAIPFKAQNLQSWNYWDLSQKQSLFLSNINFYKKMMKFKYDNGLLSGIIFFMCFQDFQFSQKLAQLFLIGLNKLDQVDDAFSLLNNIKTFLLIKDQFTLQRTKWVLGIWQHESSGRSGQLEYGLKYSNESTNIVYASSRYFMPDEKYKPALQVLYDKKNFYTDFEVRGIVTLLELLIASDEILVYILSIPPPSKYLFKHFIDYLYQTYLSWIYEYINKLQKQQHYNFGMDKNMLITNMRNFMLLIEQKKQKLIVSQNIRIPSLGKIIGKNKVLQCQEELANEIYAIKRWGHETYVLENLPQPNNENLSLPDEIFNIKQVKDYAKYFVQNCEIRNYNLEMQTQKTITSLKMQTNKPLILHFSLPYFRHSIYIDKGQIIINYPYSDLPLQKYLEIQLIKQEQIINQNEMMKTQITQHNSHGDVNEGQKMELQNYKCDMPGWSDGGVQGNSGNNNNPYEKPCPICTYLNYMRDRCQMCDTLLL